MRREILWFSQDKKLKIQSEKIEQLQEQYSSQLQTVIEKFDSKVLELEESMKRITPQVELNNFEVHLSEHCNLNCYGCSHFSSIAEQEFMSIETYKKDFNRMFELTNGNVNTIYLLGGEPLLHKDIIQFLKIGREIFQYSEINILTNAILLSSIGEEFWQACKDYNITFIITYYPINIDYDTIERIASKYDIKIGYWDYEAKYSSHFPLDLEGKQDARDNFINCIFANRCVFLRDGKLYTCVTIPNVYHFNRRFNKNVPVTENDYIDIYKASNIQEILEFIAKPVPFCKYCNVKLRTHDGKWCLSKKDINEWT